MEKNRYGIHVSDADIFSMVVSQGATVIITGPVVWSGTTNAAGYAKDINGLSPLLPYGNYSVVVSKTGYTSVTQNFTVPLAGNINITITKIYQTIDVIVSE